MQLQLSKEELETLIELALIGHVVMDHAVEEEEDFQREIDDEAAAAILHTPFFEQRDLDAVSHYKYLYYGLLPNVLFVLILRRRYRPCLAK